MVEYNEVHKIRVTRYPDGNLHYLHFQQLLAFGPGSDENIALCKPCHISSNYHSVVFPASNGNNGTDDFRNFCHSGEEECPFWEVTVDAVVERVVLFNRQDMCGYRLDGSVIQGIDRAGRVLWVVGPMSSDTEFKFIVPPKAPLQCMPRHGRMTGGPGGVFETLVGSSRVYKMEVWCDGNGYAISGIRLSWADGESTSRGQVDNGTRNELELAEDEKILVYKQGAEVSGLISYIWVKTTRKTWSLGNEHQGDRLEVWETSGSGVPIGANIRSSGTGVDAFGLLFLKPERDSDLIYPESSELPSSSSAPRNVGATPPQLEMMSDTSKYEHECHHVHKIRVCIDPDGNKHILHFQQLLAFGPNSNVNIALQKPCRISSMLHPIFFPASNGNNGIMEVGNINHSAEEECPFWEVTVDAVVQRVVLYNRPDMCRERLEGFVIRGVDRSETVLWELGPLTSDRRFEFVIPPK